MTAISFGLLEGGEMNLFFKFAVYKSHMIGINSDISTSKIDLQIFI